MYCETEERIITMSYPAKERVVNFVSILAGALTGYFLFIFSGLLGYGVFNNTKGILGDILSSGLYLAFPTFGAGYVTAIISTRNDKIHILITGLVLVVIFVSATHYNLTLKSYKEWVYPILIVILTTIGGLIGLYLKNKEKSSLEKETSPPDTTSQ